MKTNLQHEEHNKYPWNVHNSTLQYRIKANEYIVQMIMEYVTFIPTWPQLFAAVYN